MQTIFDLRKFWGDKHDKEQLDVFNGIPFHAIRGHYHLFVADVTEEEKTMLVLLGLTIDHTIAINMQEIEVGGSARMLYKSGDDYVIIEIHHATIPHTNK